MSDKDRLQKLEEALDEENLKQLKKLKRLLSVTACVLGGSTAAEGIIVGLLLYKIFG